MLLPHAGVTSLVQLRALTGMPGCHPGCHTQAVPPRLLLEENVREAERA